jgi:hypothetical protein
MPKLLSRAALGTMAFQQAKKFAQTPKGQELIARAKAVASDPANRAKVTDAVNRIVRRPGQPATGTPRPPR